MIIEPFIKEYLLLALRINKIFDGYVDSYFGPQELKDMVENEKPKSTNQLIIKVKQLKKELPEQINNSLRQRYLKANLEAMDVFINVLNGKSVDFFDQLEAILGIRPKPVQDDRKFYDLQEQFNQVYLGKGTLAERMEAYKQRRRIPTSELICNFEKALKITRKRTNDLFEDILPESESFNVRLTEEKVGWAFFNHYKGNFNSVIEINPFQPLYWTTFIPNAAHEGYPGHHTEFTVKDYVLNKQLNWCEHSIILMNTPAGVVTEGIAETATYILFTPEEKTRLELEEFCPNPKEEDSFDVLVKQFELKYKVKQFVIHLANLANIEGWSKEKLLDYGTNFGFLPKANLQSDIQFMLNPTYRIIYYTYNYGRELITNKFGFPPKLSDFKYLLSNPVLSFDLT